MTTIHIHPQTPESARRTKAFNREAAQFERELEESHAAYIERNGVTPEEAYSLNFYPYHAFKEA